jgi:hypothetical protein
MIYKIFSPKKLRKNGIFDYKTNLNNAKFLRKTPIFSPKANWQKPQKS